jgi:hypothetical protein
MTLKETILHELENADETLLEDLLRVIRWHRLSGRESRQNPKPTMTITDAIAAYREEAIASGIEIDPDEIWGNVRDKTPADPEPRW